MTNYLLALSKLKPQYILSNQALEATQFHIAVCSGALRRFGAYPGYSGFSLPRCNHLSYRLLGISTYDRDLLKVISSVTYNICNKYVWYVYVSLRRAVSGQLHRVCPPLNPAQKRVVDDTGNSRNWQCIRILL